MKIKIKSLIIIATCFFGFSSCTDILDTSPYHQVGTSNMWKTEGLTDQGVNGVYANLRNWGIYGTGNGSGSAGVGTAANTNMNNGMGQWCYDVAGPLLQTHNSLDFLYGNLTPGSGTISNLWRRLYEGVHRANDAIENIPGSPCSDEKKARLIAEVKFLRAFHYFRLNELWQGVPYYDKPIKIEECVKGQETADFIWSKIIEDLNDCIAEVHLPDNDFANGRVHKGAAYALRGKVYMHQGQWQNAINDFEKLSGLGFGLFQGDYKALFTEANERCLEMIFSVQNMELQYYGSCAQFYLGTRASQGGCWGDHYVTPFAVELYENDDSTPFNWDDYIPGYSSLALADRQIYFLRDTLDSNGKEYHTTISVAVRTRLDQLDKDGSKGVRALYLGHGNESRMRTAFDSRDPRLEKNVITPYAKYLGVRSAPNEDYTHTRRWPFVGNFTVPAVDESMGGDIQTDRGAEFLYLQRKFVTEGYDPSPTFSRDRGKIDDPIIRYADVLLMWAEALVELGNLSGAMAKVEEVRNRAGIQTLALNFTDATTARKYVRDERRREMLGEGGSYFDELRWGTLKETKYPDGASTKQMWGIPGGGAAYLWPYSYSLDKFVWPVPRSEIEMNPNLTRTPGWTY